MEVEEGILAGIKEMILLGIEQIKVSNVKILAVLIGIQSRWDDVNLHLSDQSRRIDASNKLCYTART